MNKKIATQKSSKLISQYKDPCKKTKKIRNNYQDGEGYTAAHLASRSGQTECVRILPETGLGWSKGGKYGWTPL